MTEVTEAAVPVVAATVEGQAASVVAAVAAQRARPIVAAIPLIVNFRTVAIARSGQEDAVAIGAGYAITIYAIKGSPIPGAVVA